MTNMIPAKLTCTEYSSTVQYEYMHPARIQKQGKTLLMAQATEAPSRTVAIPAAIRLWGGGGETAQLVRLDCYPTLDVERPHFTDRFRQVVADQPL